MKNIFFSRAFFASRTHVNSTNLNQHASNHFLTIDVHTELSSNPCSEFKIRLNVYQQVENEKFVVIRDPTLDAATLRIQKYGYFQVIIYYLLEINSILNL